MSETNNIEKSSVLRESLTLIYRDKVRDLRDLHSVAAELRRQLDDKKIKIDEVSRYIVNLFWCLRDAGLSSEEIEQIDASTPFDKNTCTLAFREAGIVCLVIDEKVSTK